MLTVPIMCGILSAKISDWEQLQNHEDYVKEIETKHKRKIRFWSDYKAALEKQAAKQAKNSKV